MPKIKIRFLIEAGKRDHSGIIAIFFMTNKQKWTAFFFLVIAQFMLNVDTTIVNIALPSLQRAFKLSLVNLQWIVSAYILAFGGFLLLGGKIADLFGRRRVFLTGLSGFTGASLLIGITSSASLIIPLRAIQGLAGAFVTPAAMSMILTIFDEIQLRTKALSIWTATAAVGGTFGLLIGGIFTQYLSWRWNFLVNVPIGVFKLKEFQQKEILNLVNSGQKTTADAARLFNVHPATVSRLIQLNKQSVMKVEEP